MKATIIKTEPECYKRFLNFLAINKLDQRLETFFCTAEQHRTLQGLRGPNNFLLARLFPS